MLTLIVAVAASSLPIPSSDTAATSAVSSAGAAASSVPLGAAPFATLAAPLTTAAPSDGTPDISYPAAGWWALLATLIVFIFAAGILIPLSAKAWKTAFTILLGYDGRLSTSKTIAAAWTIVIFYIVVTLVIAWPPDWAAALSNFSPTYLLLLGGPYASLVLAKVAITSKVSSGKVQKPAGDGIPRLSDLVADDNGNTDLFDTQFVVFNVAAMGFVLRAFLLQTGTGFPPIPSALVLLTGGPAAVYVSNKAISGNKVSIFAVTPTVIREKQQFTITGQYFMPGAANTPITAGTAATDAGTAASAGQQPSTPTFPSVTVAGTEAKVDQSMCTDSTIVATLCSTAGLLPGSAQLMVTTVAGQSAYLKGQLFIANPPQLDGIDRAVAYVHGTLILTGSWATPDADHPLTVLFVDSVGGSTVAVSPAATTTSSSATVTVPELAVGPSGGQFTVAVRQLGLTSTTVPVNIQPDTA